MALDAHIEELSEKHRVLQKLIDEEMAKPAADSLRVSELKRQKLRLKDRMVGLKSPNFGTRH